jgi:site-specific recombinase XerD
MTTTVETQSEYRDLPLDWLVVSPTNPRKTFDEDAMQELAASIRENGVLQDLLDRKVKDGLSFSVVDHLRWDMKQIFDMAVAEGHVQRNPALLLFTPKEAKKPVRRVMTMEEVQICFGAIDRRPVPSLGFQEILNEP